MDQAVYRHGRRQPCADLSDELAAVREEGHGWIWIGLKDPTDAEFDLVKDELQLHPLAVEDAVDGHQRPKLEIYDASLFVVVKPLRYIDATSDIETGEVMVFLGDRFVVTVRRGEAGPLAAVRKLIESDPALDRTGRRPARRDGRGRRQLRPDRPGDPGGHGAAGDQCLRRRPEQ